MFLLDYVVQFIDSYKHSSTATEDSTVSQDFCYGVLKIGFCLIFVHGQLCRQYDPNFIFLSVMDSNYVTMSLTQF